MWSLVSTENNQVKRLLANRVYTFGRKDVDFIIANDSSVSRKHGTIKVIDEESSNEPCLLVSDSSKFGTFYSKNETGNEQHLVFNKITGKVRLKHGDCLRIGVLKSIFKIKHKPLLIVTSSMSSVLQEKLRDKVSKLGGKLTTSWQTGVTHLAMQSILLNVKVTQALACACPIVSEKYFSKLLKSVETNEAELPSTNDFLPDISEQGLDKRECSFQVNVERKNIFRDKTVVFLSH
uniref:FHA domain-containing protein n=5 Tax=Ciona intestinalis TaxID=7719 RepID=F6QHZ5_CIOIN